MAWFWIVVAVIGGALVAMWWRARHVARRARAAEFLAVYRLAEEDTAHLGREIERLDVSEQEPEAEARALHQKAVDSYELARRGLAHLRGAEGVSTVTDAVAAGHNALAGVEALLAGRPAPQRRVMCFFDPRHGPSAGDAQWGRPGHGLRSVPACSADAERLANKQEPAIRTVRLGATRTLPYWAAGRSFLPYARGYFATLPSLEWAFRPPVADAAAGTPPSGAFGTGIVGSSGHFDGGGYDGSS